MIVIVSFILYFAIAFITFKFLYLVKKKSINYIVNLYKILENKLWKQFIIPIILILLTLLSFLIVIVPVSLQGILTIFLDKTYELGENGKAIVLGITGIYNFILALKIFYYDAKKDEELVNMVRELENIFKKLNLYF